MTAPYLFMVIKSAEGRRHPDNRNVTQAEYDKARENIRERARDKLSDDGRSGSKEMSDRPDLHTEKHDQWDQGGYCNNLVVDHDGTGTVCGYRKPPVEYTPTTDDVRGRYVDFLASAAVRDKEGAEFDRWLSGITEGVQR